MVILNIYEGTTEKGVSLLKNYITTFSRINDIVYARIRYNTAHLTDIDDHPLTYPLTLYDTSGFVFCIADVTAGYPGEGPQGTIEILNYLGFKFNENDILKRNDIVQIDILKDGFYLKDGFKDYAIPQAKYFEYPFTKANTNF